MSQQPDPGKAFTAEEKAKFEASLLRLSQREDCDASAQPYPTFDMNLMFWLWQQATRDTK